MLTISGCLWLAGQGSHMVVSYGQLTRKGESQRVNPMAPLLRKMSQHRILSISHMRQLKPAWGLNNLDKDVNTCLFRKCFIRSVSSVRHRQVWKRSYPGCARFPDFCTNTSIAAPAVPAPRVWSWVALRENYPALILCKHLQTWMLLWLFKIVLGQASWHFFLYFKYKLLLLALRLTSTLLLAVFFFFFLYFFTSSSIINWGIHWIHLI